MQEPKRFGIKSELDDLFSVYDTVTNETKCKALSFTDALLMVQLWEDIYDHDLCKENDLRYGLKFYEDPEMTEEYKGWCKNEKSD